MANYCATIRTNYVRVKDEEKFREIVGSMSCEDTVQVFDEVINGKKMLGFGCYGTINGLIDRNRLDDEEYDDDPDYEKMIEELQAVLHPDDAIIIMEAGYEKLRYVVGVCTVITTDCVRVVDMRGSALSLAREMLKNPSYETQMEY